MSGVTGDKSAKSEDSVDKIQLAWHELVYEKSYRPTLRNSHNVCHDSKHRTLYLFGGRSKGGCNNHLYHLSQSKLDSGWRAFDNLKGDIPPPRKNSAMGYCASYLYLFGGNGHAKKGESLLADFYAFNISTESWMNLKTRGDVPSPRDRHSLSVIDNQIYIFGGSSSSGKGGEEFLNDLYVHDPKTSTWTQIHFAADSPRPEPRYEHCAAAMGNYLVVSSGKCENGGLFDFWLFDTTQIEGHIASKKNTPKVCLFAEYRLYIDCTITIHHCYYIDIHSKGEHHEVAARRTKRFAVGSKRQRQCPGHPGAAAVGTERGGVSPKTHFLRRMEWQILFQ